MSDITEGRFRFPDGSLWLRNLGLEHPIVVIEVALGHDYQTGFCKCLERMLRFKGKIKYAVLVKINKWPKRKVKADVAKGKGNAIEISSSSGPGPAQRNRKRKTPSNEISDTGPPPSVRNQQTPPELMVPI